MICSSGVLIVVPVFCEYNKNFFQKDTLFLQRYTHTIDIQYIFFGIGETMNYSHTNWGAFFLCISVACNSDEGLKVYNSEPNISIQSHGMDALIQANVPIEFRAQASDLNHNSDSLVCSWQAYDADDNELASCEWANADSEGLSRCEMTLPNSAVRVVTQVKDPADAADLDEITVSMIEDTPPQVEILTPTSEGIYYVNTLISFSAQLFDEEDDVANDVESEVCGHVSSSLLVYIMH